MAKSKGRRMLVWIIVCMMLIGSSLSHPQVKAAGTNLVQNAGFEQVIKEEEAEGWWTYAGQTQRPGIVTDPAYVQDGSKAAYIVPASSITYNLSNLKVNTNYTLTAYVKLSDSTGKAKLGAKWYDGTKPDILQEVAGTTYTLYTVNFTTGNQTTAQVFLWSSNGLSGDQKAYIDLVAVKENNGDGSNQVANPSFERVIGDLRPASWRAWPASGNIPGTVTEAAHVVEGKRAGYIVPGSSLNYDLTGLKTNTSYKFIAYVKFSDAASGAVLGAKVGTNEIKQPVSGINYTKHEIVFQTGSQTTATVYLWDGGLLKTGQRGYIDQTSVEEYLDGTVRVSLNMSELLMAKGDQYPLVATVYPADAPNKNVTYSSSNPAVVTVDANGNLSAVGAGTATITVVPEAAGTSASSFVTVTENKEPWYPGRTTNQWVLTKEDNFGGTELDTNLWSIRGKEYAFYHRDDMVSVSDGKLKLQIAREPDGNIVLGRVDTHGEDRKTNEAKFDQKYGFFEVSAKIPPTEKTYFTFWTFNYPGVHSVDGTGKEGLEIDVTETVWQGDYTETALHWDGYDQYHRSIGSGKKPAPNIHNGFHVYGFEWTEDYLKFYYDGKLTWTYTDKANIPWVKEVFILSSGWARSPGWGEGDINNAQLPYFSEVDWFRAYQRTDLGQAPDTTSPILYGLSDIQIPMNSTIDLREKVYAIDNRDDREAITATIQIDETTLNRGVKGDYSVTYTVQDAAGNPTSKVRKVTVVDAVNPLILNGYFDNGSLEHWNYDSTKATVKQNIDRGRFASIDGGASLGQQVTVKSNTLYEVSFDAKEEVKLGNQQLTIGVNYGGSQVSKEIVSAEWANYKLRFTTGAYDQTASFYLHNVGTGKAYLDNVILVELQSN